MNVREANEAGLITVGRRIKTDASGSEIYKKPITGRIIKVFREYFRIDRDDGFTNCRINFDNVEAQIVMLDCPPPFKKGDFVKLRTGSTTTNGEVRLLHTDNITKGRTYIIDECTTQSHVRIRGTPMGHQHNTDNFVLVSSPSKTKEDNKGDSVMSENANTKSVAVNDTIMSVLEDESNKSVMLVNKWFGEEIPNNFSGKLLLEEKKDKYIEEAKNREKEATKKAAAKG